MRRKEIVLDFLAEGFFLGKAKVHIVNVGKITVSMLPEHAAFKSLIPTIFPSNAFQFVNHGTDKILNLACWLSSRTMKHLFLFWPFRWYEASRYGQIESSSKWSSSIRSHVPVWGFICLWSKWSWIIMVLSGFKSANSSSVTQFATGMSQSFTLPDSQKLDRIESFYLEM